jgi:hypothetical protein
MEFLTGAAIFVSFASHIQDEAFIKNVNKATNEVCLKVY